MCKIAIKGSLSAKIVVHCKYMRPFCGIGKRLILNGEPQNLNVLDPAKHYSMFENLNFGVYS